MPNGYFITGTDTDAGKTWATLALMEAFKKRGLKIVGMKPIASGCGILGGRLRNDDALLIRQHASVELDYDLINPYAYAEPVSPHLAGKGNPAQLSILLDCFRKVEKQADRVLVEGAGGWYAPINERQDISDLAKAFGLPVILVVGIKLGCINHARLTAEAIIAKDISLAGWIAVCNDPDMAYLEENIATIRQALDALLLGTLPYDRSADFVRLASSLNVDEL